MVIYLPGQALDGDRVKQVGVVLDMPAEPLGAVVQDQRQVERLAHQRQRLALGVIAPPAGGNGPQAEAHLADGQIGIAVRPEFHGRAS